MRRRRTTSISSERMLIRCRIRRRSVSSLVSPGPRVPMPPPSRDSAVAEPTRRGSRYFSCASSTWSLPSRVRARRAKMSRMSCVRSTTFRSSAVSRLRSCAGVSSLSKMTVSTRASSHMSASEVTLPLPRNVAGSGLGRSCNTRRATSAPAAAARPASSSSECSGSKLRDEPLKSPTSAARSRGSCAPVRGDEVRITRRILARGPTPRRRRDAAADGPRRARRRSMARRRAPAPRRRESRRARRASRPLHRL